MQGPWEGAESLEASRELGRSLEEQPAQAPPRPQPILQTLRCLLGQKRAVSITVTTKNKNKPKPILRYNLPIA